ASGPEPGEAARDPAVPPGEGLPPSPRDRYLRRADELSTRQADLSSRLTRLGTTRILTFFGAAGAFVASDWAGQPLLGILAALLSVAFVVQVRTHRRTRRELERTRLAGALAEQGVARLERRWDALPDPGPPPSGVDGHRYAADLDLFGRASLVSLLGPVHTPMGREQLARWLLEPTPGEEVPARQEAVRELAEAADQREAAAVDGAQVESVSPERLETFLDWCTDTDRLSPRSRVLAWVLPLTTGALALGDIVGLVPTAGWVLGLMVQAFVSHRGSARLHGAFARASSGVPGIRQFGRLFTRWEHWEARTPLLREEVGHLSRDGRSASQALNALGRILHLADLRLSMVYPVFAVGLLWDLHVEGALDRWRDRWGRDVPGWTEALGMLEALSALATLASDHPDWAFPEPVASPVGSGARFQARDIGHPLIPPDRCVRNDVTLGPPGTVLLVTGSNMSGKSTLLRSIGLAVVLARAGGPVCARELHLPPVRLFTSMRVKDSVEDGVSFFMAELLRLKALLDAAPLADAPPSEPPLLYLVDEILQGTNSEERQMAGRRLIRHLLRRRALGAVTTHDLELHRDPRVEAHAELVHFRESVDADGRGLSFDYRLRPGLATTRNALLLAERIGLTDPDEAPSPVGSTGRG
ncbi:MAG: hypothetical protein P8188_08060, partial [Gemmatimonadota bacterium]